MEITPNEMKNHEFSSQMRGYDKAEVKAFVDGAANALEEAYAKIEKLNNDNSSLQDRYDELKRLEDTIRSAVLEAQKNANQILANSKKESELILKEAKSDADQFRSAKEKESTDLEQKIQKLEYTKDQLYTKLRTEIEAHLKLVDSICPPDKDIKSEELSAGEHNDLTDTARIKQQQQLDMKDDDIDAALESLSGSVEESPENDEPEKNEPHDDTPAEETTEEKQEDKEVKEEAMAGVAAAEKTSNVKEEVQDGQSKGYDF